MKTLTVTVLGSTGSIGESTLDVIRRHPERWSIFALSANTNVTCMLKQCREFRPRYTVMRDEGAAVELESALREESIESTVLAGSAALDTIASDDNVDVVMAAIVGAAGLDSSLAAAMAGKKVLLANKESLVMSGRLFMRAAERSGAQLLPIDSEHNAIFQCMPPGYKAGERAPGVTRILLTGSGGPFRQLPLSEFDQISPAQACNHPNWDMGAKISVDSATMMNKGLEFIEAMWLFSVTPDDVEIVLHPESVIHSLVQYNDGSVLAQMGNPDMRTPIAHGLAWPERVSSGVSSLNLFEVAQLNFARPDFERFPCLELALDAARAGGSHSCVLNAANEIAVDAFLNERIRFTEIPKVIKHTMSLASDIELTTLAEVKSYDARAREVANANIVRLERSEHVEGVE
ncbi:MAG: 1-deoxy-D-xylulose-5-phosphate reductoisomerase [Pseudomonadales bacterium]